MQIYLGSVLPSLRWHHMETGEALADAPTALGNTILLPMCTIYAFVCSSFRYVVCGSMNDNLKRNHINLSLNVYVV